MPMPAPKARAVALSASGSTTVSIRGAVNDAPAFSGLDGAPSFTEGGAAVVLDAKRHRQ